MGFALSALKRWKVTGFCSDSSFTPADANWELGPNSVDGFWRPDVLESEPASRKFDRADPLAKPACVPALAFPEPEADEPLCVEGELEAPAPEVCDAPRLNPLEESEPRLPPELPLEPPLYPDDPLEALDEWPLPELLLDVEELTVELDEPPE